MQQSIGRMKHLTIKKIGPIEGISIELKRINVLIGLQSSGKSTISKIACHCAWVEKEIVAAQSPDYFTKKSSFKSILITFHKLEGYFNEDSSIEYETDVMKFSYIQKDESFHFEWKNRLAYIRPKLIYIPAERNIVASIPNWFEVKLEENNIHSFMSDWEEARKYYAGKPLNILNLKAKYLFDKSDNKDSVIVNEKNAIDFTNASSGLQSLIPLLVIMKFVTKGMYEEKEKMSIKDKTIYRKLSATIHDLLKSEKDNKNFDIEKINAQLVEKMSKPNFSTIFLEEPEENLYPVAQHDLMNNLMDSIHNTHKKHSIFITTHSPYILTSLNNLLYAAEVGKQKKGKAAKIIPQKYWVDFDEIGAWFVKNGKIVSIIDKKEKQIKAEKIDELSRQLNREFDKLTNLKYEV